MAKFRWHADYFDGLTSAQCVRRAIIQADNAGAAEKIAKAQMGLCERVEVRRVATAAPVRVIYAREALGKKIAPAPEMISFGWRIPTVPVAG